MPIRRELDKFAMFDDFGYEPHAGQRKVHESRASRRVLACGVRWGKTLCAAMEAVAAAMQPREKSIGWVVAPTYDLADKVFREIVDVAGRHLRHRLIKLAEHDRVLKLRNTSGGVSEIRAKSADNPVSLLGEGLDWVIVDEAARLKPAVWQSHLSQRLIDRRGWALLISTPRGKGWFHELFRRGQDPHDPTHASWNAPSSDNPHLDRNLIEDERLRLPLRVFDQEYGGRFVEGAGAVFRGVRECATGDFSPPHGGGSYRGGIDLAKVEDYTVQVILDEANRVVFCDRFHRIDWDLQVQRLIDNARRYHDALMLIDSTGAGEPIFEALRRAGGYVKPYPFSARSKSELIDSLALMIERRCIVLPRPELWPEGIEELEAFEYSVTETGHTRTSAPVGQHDDIVIALALAAWQRRHTALGGPARRARTVDPWGEMMLRGIRRSVPRFDPDGATGGPQQTAFPALKRWASHPLMRDV